MLVCYQLFLRFLKRLLHKQMSLHVDRFLSPYLYGYQKGFSRQQALISLLEKWKIVLDRKGYADAILIDLSKAIDTLNHDVLIANVYSYGFAGEFLKLIKSYQANLWQRTKVNISFSSCSDLLLWVPHGSILEPILFNIYINDFFYITELTNVCNYADDTAFHACDSDLENLINRLEPDSMLAIEWFESNYMKLNEDKCHILLSEYKHEMMFAKSGWSRNWESETQKLLGVTIDKDLKFAEYLVKQCKKAGQSFLLCICI